MRARLGPARIPTTADKLADDLQCFGATGSALRDVAEEEGVHHPAEARPDLLKAHHIGRPGEPALVDHHHRGEDARVAHSEERLNPR